MSQAGISSNKIPPPPGSITHLEGQDSVIVAPDGSGIIHVAGQVVAAGTTPFTTTGNAGTNTETWSIQLSQAIVSTNATNVGLAAFNSAKFTVDANGFVGLNGSGVGQTITGNSGGALSPSSGNWNILGSSVAAGTSPLVSSGSGSTLTFNVQRSQAIASADSTKTGICNFNSAQFTVDANGFVTSLGAGFVWIDQGTSITLAVNTGYFVTAATTQTLPASPAQGDTVKIICDTTGAVVVTANTGQTIRAGNQVSSSAGTFTSTARGDSLELFYRASTTQWIALNTVGTFLVA